MDDDLGRKGDFRIIYEDQSSKLTGVATLGEVIVQIKSDPLYPRLSLWEKTDNNGCVQISSRLFK
jgi:hypothetical protein